MSHAFEFRIPATAYRAHQIPFDNGTGQVPKVASAYVQVEHLPGQLKNWLRVNPRVPSLKKGTEELKGPVAKAIITTLMEAPEMMAIKNNGIYILSDHVEFDKEAGGQGIIKVRLTDPDQHGVVNGGHTLAAIFQVAEDPDRPDPWNAYVRLHLYEGIDASIIPEIAEGMNRSMQVDDKSLEHLRGIFQEIEQALEGKTGADRIAYNQGSSEPVDVHFILTVLSMLNLDRFPDWKSHPNILFGQPRKVLAEFGKDVRSGKEGEPGYRKILPRLHEVLVLSDRIQKQAATRLGRLKVKNTGKNARVRSEKHKARDAYFEGGKIEGFIPLGWLYPMVSALRANISRETWDNGSMEWLLEPDQLLDETIDPMCDVIRQEHIDNKEKPAEVGKKEAAYRGCYSITMMAVAQRGLLTPSP